MYTRFFGLNEKPFAITPDPRYLYMSERHAEALAHLMYGLNEAGGFIQLTGEVGTGKTTVIRTLLEQLPQHADVALIVNPALTPVEFLQAICHELHIAPQAGIAGGSKPLIDALNAHLLERHARGRRVVVIVDEAQNLPADTLEQVRMLTNLETATHKLLQIILIGQPELRELLAHSNLRQLAQRITGRYHLGALSRDDTAAYVWHRMKVAGSNAEVFSTSALREVHRLTRGVPRLINIICDRALLAAYTLEQPEIDAALVRAAANEVGGHWRSYRWWPWMKWTVAAVLAMAAISVAGMVWHQSKPVSQAVIAVYSASPSPSKKAAPVDVSTLFKQLPADGGTDGAFAALFDLWHIKLASAAGVPCDQASAAGLQCVYQKGLWSQLAGLNRPAILQLNDDNGTVHQAVLARVHGESADVMVAGERREVTVASLARYWNGEYLVLWRPAIATQHPLTLGARGEEVTWVRKALQAAQQELPLTNNDSTAQPASRSPDYFDADLVKQVVEFQRLHHLDADGVAGMQTLIALDALLNDDHGPLLFNHSES